MWSLKIVCTARAMASKVESFSIDYVIRGYHFYKDVWLRFTAEKLYCRYDVCGNHNHPFAVVTYS